MATTTSVDAVTRMRIVGNARAGMRNLEKAKENFEALLPYAEPEKLTALRNLITRLDNVERDLANLIGDGR